jgi:hypothetical protein
MTAAEANQVRVPMPDAVELAHRQPQSAAVVRAHVASDGIADFLGSAYSEIMIALDEQDLTPAGPPSGGGDRRETGSKPKPDLRAPAQSPRRAESCPRCCRGLGGHGAVHHGDYAGAGATYRVLSDWVADHGTSRPTNRGNAT